MGNYVSNQRERRKDGGCMVKIVLTKKEQEVEISEKGLLLTWVYKKYNGGKYDYYVLPCSKFENDSDFFNKSEDFEKMKLFIADSRKLFNDYNISVGEYIYVNKNWTLKEKSELINE